MITPAHFFGGYIALQATKKIWQGSTLSSRKTFELLIFGLILSMAIDLDVLFVGGITGHHEQLTHYPFFWLFLSVVVYILGRLAKNELFKSVAIVTFIASWTHMALDLFGVTMGVYWLWPFSMKEFSITPLRSEFASEQERWRYLLSSPITLIGDSTVVILGGVRMLMDILHAIKNRLGIS